MNLTLSQCRPQKMEKTSSGKRVGEKKKPKKKNGGEEE